MGWNLEDGGVPDGVAGAHADPLGKRAVLLLLLAELLLNLEGLLGRLLMGGTGGLGGEGQRGVQRSCVGCAPDPKKTPDGWEGRGRPARGPPVQTRRRRRSCGHDASGRNRARHDARRASASARAPSLRPIQTQNIRPRLKPGSIPGSDDAASGRGARRVARIGDVDAFSAKGTRERDAPS